MFPVADRSAALKEEWRIKQLPRKDKLALVSNWVSGRARERRPHMYIGIGTLILIIILVIIFT